MKFNNMGNKEDKMENQINLFLYKEIIFRIDLLLVQLVPGKIFGCIPTYQGLILAFVHTWYRWKERWDKLIYTYIINI